MTRKPFTTTRIKEAVLLGFLTLGLSFFIASCSKSFQAASGQELAETMMKDQDVRDFFHILPHETIAMGATLPPSGVLAKYANDSAEFHRQISLFRKNKLETYKANLPNSEQTLLLTKKAELMEQRYKLSKLSEAEKQIFLTAS